MIIEVDCVIDVKEIFNDLKRYTNNNLISRIQEFYKRDWHVVIKRILKEANFALHIMTGLMKDYLISSRIFYVSSANVANQICLDIQFVCLNLKGNFVNL